MKDPKNDAVSANRLTRRLSKFFGDAEDLSPAQTEFYRHFSSYVRDYQRGKIDGKVRREATNNVLGLARELRDRKLLLAAFRAALWAITQAVEEKTLNSSSDLLIEIVNQTRKNSLPRKKLSAYAIHHGRGGALRDSSDFKVFIFCDAEGNWSWANENPAVEEGRQIVASLPARDGQEEIDWFS
jgi:hypothetical protein